MIPIHRGSEDSQPIMMESSLHCDPLPVHSAGFSMTRLKIWIKQNISFGFYLQN